MNKPLKTSVPEWYHRYLDAVLEDNMMDALANSKTAVLAKLNDIAPGHWAYRYAAEKWSIKEMIQHLVDTERIFAYRALCIARGEQASLPGFDENSYAVASRADKRTKGQLLEEFETVRNSILQLFQSFDDEDLEVIGSANGKPFTANAIGYLTAGHSLHHMSVLEERYLPGLLK